MSLEWMPFSMQISRWIDANIPRARRRKAKPKAKPGPRTVRVELLEPCKDFEVRIRSYSLTPERKTVRVLELSGSKIKASAKKLKQKFAELQEKYPSYTWKVERVRVKRRIFWRMERKRPGDRSVPVYYSASAGKVFVPKSYVKKNYRLTCSVLSYRLRDLGAGYRLAHG